MNYKKNREHLKTLSNSELKDHFWNLTKQIVNPLVDLAKTHTTPSIERSVLLRMGFNSLQCHEIVNNGIQFGFIPKGMGNVVYRYAKNKAIPILEAGKELLEDENWENINKLFE